MKYIPVIGLEIHAELLTESKVFCGCKNEFGGMPNGRVCPKCSGMPGTLPLVNKEAITLAVRAGFALNCKINNYSSFDRKNYFYPDLPKAYQITQFESPICKDGHVKIENCEIRINRIHIEEDAGKLVHDDIGGISMADYNRCGVPLIEIVTEPDFRNIGEVQKFVEQVALDLKYAEVCDARLEQGSMRVDVNISIMKEGSKELGTRAEIKNLNSIKSIGRAIEFEIKRQSEILDNGGRVVQETRRFNDRGDTTVLRSKEEAHDYRYFPEPDIPPLVLKDKEINKIKESMPEMPNHRIMRYTEMYHISLAEAKLIVANKAFSDFYDKTVAVYPLYKEISNLMLGTLSRCFNNSGKTIEDIIFTPKSFAVLAKMSEDGQISKNGARDILSIMFETGKEPMEIAVKCGIIMNNDVSKLEEIVCRVLSENAESVDSYRTGKTKALAFLMGQVMRFSGKGTNPILARELLIKKLT